MRERGVLLAVVLGLFTAGAHAAAPRGEARTLSRPYDPVVVRTGLLTPVPDRSTASYRVYAARGGRLEPIPFQFDQRGRDGELVLSDDGHESDFTFDADDELVFMANDTGDRLAGTSMPTGGDAAIEMDVTDPSHAAHGWVYLVHFAGDPPPRSPIRYVTFDSARQEADAASYRVSYSHDRSNFLKGVRIPPAAGGTGENLIAGVAMRISPTFSFLLTSWRPTLTERSFSVVPDGVKNGPVRAVRRVRQSLELGKAFPEVPSGKVCTYYYASSFTTPSTFSIPWVVLKTLRDFRFESVDQFGALDGDMRYWDAANPEGVSFADGQRPAQADSDHDWWVVSGSRGTFLHALVIPPQWRAWGIRRGIVFNDSSGAEADHDVEAGAGYSLLRMTNLQRAGAYQLDTMLVVLSHPYRPGDEIEALGSERAPLQTEVRAAELESGVTRHAAAGR